MKKAIGNGILIGLNGLEEKSKDYRIALFYYLPPHTFTKKIRIFVGSHSFKNAYWFY